MVKPLTNIIQVLSLYRTDYSTGIHIRQAARLIGTTHPTSSTILNEMEELGLLRSMREGKNKTYYLNTSNIIVKEYLSITERFTTIEFIEGRPFFKRFMEEVNALNLSASLVLFGSQVKGYSTEESDVDILVVGSVTKSQKDAMKELGSKYGKEISIKNASTKSLTEGLRNKDPLLLEIESDHVILYNHDLFLDYLWDVRS